jgi:hypothetical protein
MLEEPKKKCGGCKKEYVGQLAVYFYKDSLSKDGFLKSCKECRKKASKRYLEKNADEIREKKRLQYNDPNREDSRKRYLKTETGKQKLKMSQKKWREANPERYSAYQKVKWQIQKGAIARKPCGVCAHPKASFYHADYNEPLEVYWRCFKHKNIVDSQFSECLNEAINNNRISQENTR